MARIRTVKPELADDEKLGSISRDARLLFIMTWCHSDDFGVVKGNLRWLQAQIFPYDTLKPGQFQRWVEELVSIDAIRPFEVNGEKFFYIKNFQRHQVINKPSKQSRNPEPPNETLRESSGSPTVALPEDYAEEGKGKERKGREQEGKGEEENVCAPKLPHGEFQNVLLTDQELEKLQGRFGREKTSALIERLSSGIASKGYKYSSHYATILNWEKREPTQGKSPPGLLPGKTAGNKELIERMIANCGGENDTG